MPGAHPLLRPLPLHLLQIITTPGAHRLKQLLYQRLLQIITTPGVLPLKQLLHQHLLQIIMMPGVLPLKRLRYQHLLQIIVVINNDAWGTHPETPAQNTDAWGSPAQAPAAAPSAQPAPDAWGSPAQATPTSSSDAWNAAAQPSNSGDAWGAVAANSANSNAWGAAPSQPTASPTASAPTQSQSSEPPIISGAMATGYQTIPPGQFCYSGQRRAVPLPAVAGVRAEKRPRMRAVSVPPKSKPRKTPGARKRNSSRQARGERFAPKMNQDLGTRAPQPQAQPPMPAAAGAPEQARWDVPIQERSQNSPRSTPCPIWRHQPR